MLKKALRQVTPELLISLYHFLMAYLAAVLYRFPSRKLTVIGVTGTNGKTTTAYLIAHMLQSAGMSSGLTSTAIFKIGQKEWLNDKKMTMLGRFQSQKLLRQMVKAGCSHAVVETSSEGIKQYRHRAIVYHTGVFTNLTPEHLQAHGGFENYKKAKQKLFRLPLKQAVINADDPSAEDFMLGSAHRTLYSTDEHVDTPAGAGIIVGTDIQLGSTTRFKVNGVRFELNMPGLFNVYNALAAVATVNALGVPLELCAGALRLVKGVPGRLEMIDEGQDYSVMIDYAPEVASLESLYEVVDTMPHGRIIHVLGSCGGGRDADRRPKLGSIAARNADVVIVTNEDPYDEDPRAIIESVADGAKAGGKQEGEDLFLENDRQSAIQKALSLAEKGDLVLVTGKGSEQALCVAGGKKIPWDDREVARSAIKADKKSA